MCPDFDLNFPLFFIRSSNEQTFAYYSSVFGCIESIIHNRSFIIIIVSGGRVLSE